MTSLEASGSTEFDPAELRWNPQFVHNPNRLYSLFLLTKVNFKMRRSELEVCIDILRALAQKGPLKLTHVMYKSNVNCSALKERLKFLIKQDLVEKRAIAKQRVVYAVTEKGKTLLKQFNEIVQVLPLVEEARDYITVLY